MANSQNGCGINTLVISPDGQGSSGVCTPNLHHWRGGLHPHHFHSQRDSSDRWTQVLTVGSQAGLRWSGRARLWAGHQHHLLQQINDRTHGPPLLSAGQLLPWGNAASVVKAPEFLKETWNPRILVEPPDSLLLMINSKKLFFFKTL